MLACRYVKLHEAVPPLIEFLRNLSRVALTKLFSKSGSEKITLFWLGLLFWDIRIKRVGSMRDSLATYRQMFIQNSFVRRRQRSSCDSVWRGKTALALTTSTSAAAAARRRREHKQERISVVFRCFKSIASSQWKKKNCEIPSLL